MDYEKAYKEAIESIKRIYDQADTYGKELMEKEFPELTSEDEKIRKTLREIIIDHDPNNEILIKEVGISQKQFLAWLEKQGEQKPTWSEEDEEILRDTIGAVYAADYYTFDDKRKIESWLKSLKDRYTLKPNVEQLTAFAVHLNKRGAFCEDLCMDFEHEAQSFIEMQTPKEL